jgi:hypothetical protein
VAPAAGAAAKPEMEVCTKLVILLSCLAGCSRGFPAQGAAAATAAIRAIRSGLWSQHRHQAPFFGLVQVRASLSAEDKNDGLKWFVKTEMFKKPFPVVKPHLEAHRAWVAGVCEIMTMFAVVSSIRI